MPRYYDLGSNHDLKYKIILLNNDNQLFKWRIVVSTRDLRISQPWDFGPKSQLEVVKLTISLPLLRVGILTIFIVGLGLTLARELPLSTARR